MRQAKQGTRGVPSDVVTDARHTSVVRGAGQSNSMEKLQSSDASDASHETESCEHTGTRAGSRYNS